MASGGWFDKSRVQASWFDSAWFDPQLDAVASSSCSTGSLSATESGTDSASLNGALSVSGSVSVTESGNDSVALSASVLIQGDVSVADSGTDVAAIGSSALIQCDVSASETGSDSFSADGVLDSALSAISGFLNAIESGADSFIASLTAEVTQQPQPSGAGGSWVIPRKKLKRENDEAFLLAII